MCSAICGGSGHLVMSIPTDIDRPYRMLVGYSFNWRERVGKVECDCQIIEQVFRPWHGFHWNHNSDCAIEKHLRRYPGIYNFCPDAGGMIAHTE